MFSEMLLTTSRDVGGMFVYIFMHASVCLWMSITIQLEIAWYNVGDGFHL
jgi:hypothetical protein